MRLHRHSLFRTSIRAPMSLPQVVIVGRPNVGKSSILNWIAGKFVSVVDPTAGVTRDRVTYLVSHVPSDFRPSKRRSSGFTDVAATEDEAAESEGGAEGEPAEPHLLEETGERFFELVDTGGMGVVDVDDLSADVEYQIQTAIESADVVVFVVDAHTGPAPLDELVITRVRKLNRPTLLVVNKADSPRYEAEAPQFYGFGNFPTVLTSVKGNTGRRDLLDAIVDLLPPAEAAIASTDVSDPVMKLAVVGRRNVGKSTFINALAEEQRMIVSEVAGTTRDSVDVRFERDGRVFVAIDTPGVRKKKSLANDIEFYGLVRAQKSIRRADVILMFFDATETISKVDKQLLEFIADQHTPCIFVINKWDRGLDEKMTTEKWAEYLEKTMPTLAHVPIAFITAKTSKNIWQLINLSEALFKQARERVGTGALNRVVEAAYERNQPRYVGNKRGKIFYATQVAVAPPTIVMKVNESKLFEPNWRRYMLGTLRDDLPFDEVPVKVIYRGRGTDESDDG